MATDPATKAAKVEDAMLKAVRAYLESRGWRVGVIGGARVKQRSGDLKYKYEFVLRFTGGEGLEVPRG